MKRLSEVPIEALEKIKSEHEQALDKLFSQTICTYRMPMHVVAMRIKRFNKSEGIDRVIIPAIVIHLTDDAFITKNTLDRNGIKYSLQSTRRPFPFGHVYQNSGHVCLGNIFVPSEVSCHSPQQPLETLFLYNDRNVNHGESRITLTAADIIRIEDILKSANIQTPDAMREVLIPDYNLVRNDAIWALSAFVLHANPQNAFAIMHQIFDIVFPPVDEYKSNQ